MTYRRIVIAVMLLAALSLAACRVLDPEPVPTLAVVATVPPTAAATSAPELPTAEPPTAAPPTAEPTEQPLPTATVETAEPQADDLPVGIAYDLGEATIIQDQFPADSRFREMPVQLNGVMAVPRGDTPAWLSAPHPVVLILHGTHPGCPVNDAGVDRWPCDPDVEQPNFMGFEYLVRELAARGYVALAININAENTFGFGEPRPGERLAQIVDLHLSALAEAAAGGTNNFGVDLEGVADMRRLALIGHSRGGEMSVWLSGEEFGGQGLASDYAFVNRGYGPVRGLLLVAPAVSLFEPQAAPVPMGIILPACDGDVIDLAGQKHYEAARLSAAPNAPVVSVQLAGANHNGFNTILGGDMIAHTDRLDCETQLAPEAQRQFLVDFAADFLTTIFSPDPTAVLEASARLGQDVTAPAPDTILGRPALIAALPAAADRRPVFTPADENELTTNRLGGAIAADGVATLFCRAGYFTADVNPGQDPCRRPTVTVPGYPAMAVVGWTEPGGALRFELPTGQRDLSGFTTVTLRAAVDSLSPLNAAEATQSFSVRLTDAAGNVAAAATRPDAPALRFPIGATESDVLFDELFLGLAPLTTIRLPLADFAGVDLTDVVEIALVFDQTPSGNLFLGDLELVRPPGVVGANSTLLSHADEANAALSGVARFDGAATCTGVFVAPIANPDAPAYLLTNGHCAQNWDANGVFIDVPVEGWSATFNYFADAAEAQVRVPAARVAYSTMKGRDVAVVELAATVGELQAQGIEPLPLAGEMPEGVFPLRVVGAPISGVPGELAYLRQEECLTGGRVDLFEFIWHFNDAVPNACRDIFGGSSGSPVFAGDDNSVFGLMNTTTVGGLTPCALGSPCEGGPEGTVWRADTSYATPVVGLGACFDAAGAFDLAAEGCPLDDGRQLLISGYPTQGTRNPLTLADGTTAAATWGAELSGDLPYYRTKIGRAGQVDCRTEEGYGAPIALADAALIDEPLPAEEGSYLLCVVAGQSATVDETWQPAAWATVARAEVDNTPPTLTPQVMFYPDGFGGFRFEPLFITPELSHFEVKFGPVDEVDCADPTGFAPYRRFPFDLPAEQLPARLCVIGYDTPGNAGAVHEIVVGE